jgi:peptide/nickel transport system substrate-binding protein
MLARSTLVLLLAAATLAGGCLQSGKRRKKGGGGAAASTRGDGGLADAAYGTGLPDLGPLLAAPPGPEGTPEAGGTLRVHVDFEPPHLLHMLQPDEWIVRIAGYRGKNVFETLIGRDPHTYELKGVLAERWEVEPDHKAMTFHLREGVKWHDGKPFTQSDVLFTFDKLLDKRVKSTTQRADFETLTKVEPVGKTAVRLHWKRPNAFALEALSQLDILPRHVYADGDLNKHPALRRPVGTGPFRFVRWLQGDEIVLERNPDYWGQPAHLDRVVFKVVRDRGQALAMAKRDELDLVDRLLPDHLRDQLDSPRLRESFRLIQQTPNMFSFYLWNTRHPLFADPRTRRAMTLLINRELLVREVDHGLAKPVSGPYWLHSPEYDQGIPPWPYDPPQARALLDEAGWKDSDNDGIRDKDGVKAQFTFLCPVGSRTLERQLTILQQDLRRAGIVMDVQRLDWSAFPARLHEQRFDATGFMYGLGYQQDNYQLFHSSQFKDGQNHGAYHNADVDHLLEAIREELDETKRNELSHRLHRIIHQDQPLTFISTPVVTSLVSRRLRGIYPSVLWYQMRDIWIPKALQGQPEADPRPDAEPRPGPDAAPARKTR